MALIKRKECICIQKALLGKGKEAEKEKEEEEEEEETEEKKKGKKKMGILTFFLRRLAGFMVPPGTCCFIQIILRHWTHSNYCID